MSTANKYMQSASGVGGAGLDVEEVFSTFLYTGTGSAQTITNGIDLSGEGGLVWIKWRSGTVGIGYHLLVDTERGANYWLSSGTTGSQNTTQNSVTAFNSNGFSVVDAGGKTNYSGDDYASWTFRKAPKFFDVVTYTGNGTAGRTVSHNLDAVPGMIIVKNTSTGASWSVFHRSRGENKQLYLNLEIAEYNDTTNGYFWNNTAPTSTEFTVGTNDQVNGNTYNYVAYLFAHNDGDGEFGPDADQDIIKCGSYTGNNTTGNSVDLGFEPQWLLIKNATYGAGNDQGWWMVDTMRGITTGGSEETLQANISNVADNYSRIDVTATGFSLTSGGELNRNSDTFIYMAIRRGTAVPTSATDVFALGTRGSSTPGFTSNFPVDMFQRRYTTGSGYPDIGSRLTGPKAVQTSETFAEGNDSSSVFDHMDGYYTSSSADSTHFSWMWKRASTYFDVVAYTGTGSARTVSHNLGVAPEMMWVKIRSGSGNWAVYAAPLGATKYLILSSNGQSGTYDGYWNDTTPTSSVFSLKTDALVNASGSTYIAYLFATLDGISKVGSVTHSGTTNVDCGFSSGSRFVLLKRTDATGDWYIWDSTRGIVSGNDPYFLLNTRSAEVTNTDYIDLLSSGFTITSSFTAGDYIFYAIA